MTRAGVAGPTGAEAVAGICMGCAARFTTMGAVVLGGRAKALALNELGAIFTSAIFVWSFGVSSDAFEIAVFAGFGGGAMMTAGVLPADQIMTWGRGTGFVISRLWGNSG